MNRVIASVLLSVLSSGPVAAQESEPPSLMERGADMFLDGLLNEMEPALKGMQDFVEEMGPALKDLMTKVEDWSVYEAPEMLPNGDIVIRRKEPLDPERVPDSPDGEDPVEDPLEEPQIDL